MTLQFTTAALLTVAACLAAWRSRVLGWRARAVWLQVPAAIMLYFTLYPPLRPQRSDALTIMTAGATRESLRAAPSDQPIVALPEANPPADLERAPDLATALRRYPAVRNLTILGAGLSARDRPPTETINRFDPAPQCGIVELQAPSIALLGHELVLRGRATPPTARVELHDPSGAIADQINVSTAGDFILSTVARGEGALHFEIQAFDTSHAPIDTASVPVVVHLGQGISAIVRAGAVNAELKYWHRWAADAGMQLKFSAVLTEGVAASHEDSGLNPMLLAQTDFVVIDARAWTALEASEKSALFSAVADGLGLLLRVDGPTDAVSTADWHRFGIALEAGKMRTVTLDHRSGLREGTAFAVAPVRLPAGGHPLLSADDGETLASWQSFGKGRFGIWLLLDSYQLVLSGEAERYASLWSDVVNTLARPRGRGASAPSVPQYAWVDERAIICELGDAASVAAPDGASVTLVRDESKCAGYWPAVAGWHILRAAGTERPFYVRAPDDSRGLRNARDEAATVALISEPNTTNHATGLHSPRPRWPFFFGWLVLSAEIWRQEKKRVA